MKRLLVFLILLAATQVWAGEPGMFALHAVADKPGANTPDYEQVGADGVASTKLPLELEVLLDDSALRSARVDDRPAYGGPVVYVVLTDVGKRRFAEVTTKHVHKKLGIVLNGRLASAPIVNEPILGGSLEISGNFTRTVAANLVARFNASTPAA